MTIIYSQRELLAFSLKKRLEGVILRNPHYFVRMYRLANDEGEMIALQRSPSQYIIEEINKFYVVGFLIAYCVDGMHMAVAHYRATLRAIDFAQQYTNDMNKWHNMRRLNDLVIGVMEEIVNDVGIEL